MTEVITQLEVRRKWSVCLHIDLDVVLYIEVTAQMTSALLMYLFERPVSLLVTLGGWAGDLTDCGT